MPDNENPTATSLGRDDMANERTFLAWIRTSIGVMAFGFVVEKFTFFLKQIAWLTGKAELQEPAHQTLHGFSSLFGIILVGLGALLGFLAFIKYKMVQKQLKEGNYRPSILLEIMLTLSVLAIALFLIVYMLNPL